MKSNVIIAPIIGSGLSFSNIAEIASPQAPTETKMKVPNPIGLWDFCLSRPNIEDNIKTIKEKKGPINS